MANDSYARQNQFLAYMSQPIVMQDKIRFSLTTPDTSPGTAGTVTRHIGLAEGPLHHRENREYTK